MNVQLQDQQVLDEYDPSTTIGPLAGVMEAADITIRGAAVLATFARKEDTGVQTWEDGIEYLLKPGNRTVSQICGAQFRNAIAGAPALVTASLQGPDVPILGPLQPSDAALGPPLFPPGSLTLIGAGSGHATIFDGEPPDGYSAIAVYVNSRGVSDPVWLSIEPEIFSGGGFNFLPPIHIYILPQTVQLFVFPANTNQLNVELLFGTPGDTYIAGAWPTNLPPGSYMAAQNSGSRILHESAGIAGSSQITLDLDVPFFGAANLNIINESATNAINVIIQTEDETPTVQAYSYAKTILQAAAAGQWNTEQASVFIPPGRTQVIVDNLGGAAIPVNTVYVDLQGVFLAP